MKKRTINILELVAQIALLALLLWPHFLFLAEDPDYVWAQEVVLPLTDYSYISYLLTAQVYTPLAIVALMVVNAIMCAASVFSKSDEKDGIVHTVVPVIVLIAGLLFFTYLNAPFGYTAYIRDISQFAAKALSALVVVLALIKRSRFVAPKQKAVQDSRTAEISKVNELKMYKELLDEGTITQEEFDAKKKQLLGL